MGFSRADSFWGIIGSRQGIENGLVEKLDEMELVLKFEKIKFGILRLININNPYE